MSLEQRVKVLEAEIKRMYDIMEDMAKSQAQSSSLTSQTATSAQSVADVVTQLSEQVSRLNVRAYEVQSVVFWMGYVLEKVEQIAPPGTLDLILNSVEENLDRTAEHQAFWDLFENWR